MTDRQHGMALIGVLGLIPIAALITLMALERSILQTRTASTALDRTIALEVAESALRRAADSAGQWARPPLDPVPPASAAQWRGVIRDQGRVLAQPDTAAALLEPPAVLVERLAATHAGDCGDTVACGYRLSVLAHGRAPGTEVVLQATTADQSAVRTWRELR